MKYINNLINYLSNEYEYYNEYNKFSSYCKLYDSRNTINPNNKFNIICEYIFETNNRNIHIKRILKSFFTNETLRSTTNFDEENKFHQTPFFLACAYGDKYIVKLMLDYKVKINLNHDQGEPFLAACSRNNFGIINLLFKYYETKKINKLINFNIKHEEIIAFIHVSMLYDKKVLKLLLTKPYIIFNQNHKFRISKNGSTLLTVNYVTINLLIINGKDEYM